MRFRAQPPPKPRDQGFLRVVPSLVVEVLSFSTRKHDRTEKVKIYAQSGIEEYWLVDPELRTVTVRTLVEERYVDEPSVVSGLIRCKVLPELELTIEDVFRALEAVDPNR